MFQFENQEVFGSLYYFVHFLGCLSFFKLTFLFVPVCSMSACENFLLIELTYPAKGFEIWNNGRKASCGRSVVKLKK